MNGHGASLMPYTATAQHEEVALAYSEWLGVAFSHSIKNYILEKTLPQIIDTATILFYTKIVSKYLFKRILNFRKDLLL